ncbi:suppressor of fused domain protein, partial [Stenotrophomonas sp. RS-48]|nr:suppressor of fused domain protein [Stenotrophomonas sp. RS-48]
MTTPSEHCKIVANHALKIFGGNPKVQAYYSDDRSRSIDILTSIDPADNEIESISTIGLSETPLFTQSEEEFFTRIELCAGTMTHEKYWRNAIVSAALHIR